MNLPGHHNDYSLFFVMQGEYDSHKRVLYFGLKKKLLNFVWSLITLLICNEYGIEKLARSSYGFLVSPGLSCDIECQVFLYCQH